MRPVHDRMSVIIEPADWPAWLGEAKGDPTALLRPAPDDVLGVWPIGVTVRRMPNDGPDLLTLLAG